MRCDGFILRFDAGCAQHFTTRPAATRVLGCRVLMRGFIAGRAGLVAALGADALAGAPDDRALMAAAYHRWGSGLQKHVCGEYSVAIYDERAGSLLVTQDTFGLRPVFYRITGTLLEAATHLDALIDGHAEPDLDEDVVAELLAWGVQASPRTVWRGVRSLAGGHSLLAGQDRVAKVQTYTLADVAPVRLGTDGEYDAAFRSLLNEALRDASAGRTWSELSGGMDSSSIVCALADAGRRDAETVSIVYSRSRTADETAWMRPVIERYGLAWHRVDADVFQPFSAVPDRFLAEPTRMIVVWRLFTAYEALLQGAGVDVVLSGLGGDQVMFGDSPDPLHIADLLSRLRLIRLARELRAWQRAEVQPRAAGFNLVRYGVLPLYRHRRGLPLRLDRRAQNASPWLTAETLRRAQDSAEAVRAPAPRLARVADQHFAERLWPVGLYGGHQWNQVLRGTDTRYPLLDRRLVEFLYAIPLAQKMRPGQDRVLQRRALGTILPAQISQRRGKAGPDEAFARGLRDSAAMRALLTNRPRIVARGYVDATAWAEAVSAAQHGYLPSPAGFQMACAFEIWLQQFEHKPILDSKRAGFAALNCGGMFDDATTDNQRTTN